MRLAPPFAVARHVANPGAVRGEVYGAADAAVLDADGARAAKTEIARWPGYAPTPLRVLPGLAAALEIADLRVKDESGRFGLGSFKALGGAYAVSILLKREIARVTGIDPTTADLRAGRFAEAVRRIVVACATDGNHGRSVAWGARMFGCGCAVFLHERVSAARQHAIERFGARIVRTPGSYDDSVRATADAAAREGWFVISDTSYPGYTDVPRDVMQGYVVMADEALDAWPDAAPPTHVFVQGGVGGLAAAVAAAVWRRYGSARPLVVCVEPEKADCLLRSAAAGAPVSVPGDLDTVMSGLACGEVSMVAWPLIARAVDHFLALPDEASLATMRLLAGPPFGDAPIVSGDSGAVGVAGLWAARADPALSGALRLDSDSRVLAINSEGDTDPEFYAKIAGRTADAVLAGREAVG